MVTKKKILIYSKVKTKCTMRWWEWFALDTSLQDMNEVGCQEDKQPFKAQHWDPTIPLGD